VLVFSLLLTAVAGVGAEALTSLNSTPPKAQFPLEPKASNHDDVSISATLAAGLDIRISAFNVDSNIVVPDTMGAVGPDHIVETINSNFEIFDKDTGASLETRTLESFWQNRMALTPSNNRFFDPRVVFDWDSQRWFALSIDDMVGTTSNSLYLARSDSADPTGDWDGFSIDADTVGAEEFHDYPTLGIDADGLYSCTQDFPEPPGPESCYSFPKADLLLDPPSAANVTRFEATPAGLVAVSGSWQPAVNFEASDGHVPLLGTTGTALMRTDIQNGGGPGATLGTAVAVTGAPAHAAPPLTVRQPDDSDTGDGIERIENVAPRFVGNVIEIGDRLWAVHSVMGTAGNSALRWYRINEATNTLEQSGLIEDTARDFIDPSIAANDEGFALIGYTCSGLTQAASVCTSAGQTDGLGVTTFDPPAVNTPGAGVYYRDGFAGAGARNRWGDYSATVTDPSDPCTFWTFQEYVDTAGVGDLGPTPEAEDGTWGIRAIELSPEECVGDADLVVSKDCVPDVLPAGQTGTCTIVIENQGPRTAQNVGLSDVYTSGGQFNFGTVTTSAGSCNTTPNPQVNSGTVTCNLGDIAEGDTVTVQVALSAAEGQTISDTATVTSDNDPDTSDNSAQDSIQITPVADLSITKKVVREGTGFRYTLTVKNNGPSTATGVVVTDDLPAGMTAGPVTSSNPAFICTDPPGSVDVRCAAPSLAPGATATFSYFANLPSTATPGATLTNTARVQASTPDPNTSNNVATAQATVPACQKTGTNVIGTSGNDVLCGTSGPDNITGLSGDDIIFGFGGNDDLTGGSGNDVMFGGPGADRLTGGDGNDRLFGNDGNDELSGGGGSDLGEGGAGADVCTGTESGVC
jgi:uncharacterized repeat protein (TIGR01451 family)